MKSDWGRSLYRCGIMAILSGAVSLARAENSDAVKAIFADPPRQYASAPLWTWNDMLTEDQIRSALGDLAGQKVKQVFVHPRPGLMTPYLSADWFRLWKVALEEAERLDMNIWIYDENSYPSGFAGGWVPELMPESRGRGLVFREVSKPDQSGPDVVGVYCLKEDGFENVTERARTGADLPEARYLIAEVQRAKDSPWHGNRCYVDLLYPGVTEKFLEVTLEAYRREIGDQFGKRVPGSFTDEPQIRPAGGLPWTDHLPGEFEKRWGYRLTDHLPSLVRPVGRWKEIRHNYFQVLLEQFIEHWARPYYEYCEKHGLQFTGHYWDHEWPNCSSSPDNMATAAWQHIPGIDCLMNQYSEQTHGQFGNVRMVRELSSVANQLGRTRALCELYGAGGWDLRFEDMKRIGDWLEVLGVNLLDEHLSYVTIRGARKTDHPQSFSYHEPWWDSYHVIATYFTRLTAAMSSGRQLNEILVLEPTTSAWMYQADKTQAAHLNEIGNSFFDLVMLLERAQVEYDIGCEDIIAHHGRIEAKSGEAARLVIGKRAYSTVVLPSHTESVNSKTIGLLEEYATKGGRVIYCGSAPTMVDGKTTDCGQQLVEKTGWKQMAAENLPQSLLSLSRDGFAILRAKDDSGILLHHRRRLDDGEILLLVNTSIESPSSGIIEARAKGVERWICESGQIAPYAFTAAGERIRATFEIPPCGSLLLFLSQSPRQPAPIVKETTSTVTPLGPTAIRRTEPNVLTLDHVDITAGGETRKSIYYYEAAQTAFRKNGMERNPWDSAVQFKDEIITKEFPPDSGFEATYRFTIEGQAPKPLWIVIERPDLYTITCNGQSVRAAKGEWWLDKAFGKIDLSRAAKSGENAVTIKASPFTIYHELQPAYVLGDFGLKAASSGFVIAAPEPLRINGGSGWNQQGHPFYGAAVTYAQTFRIPQPKGRYRVSLPSWRGSVAKVLVNGRTLGHLVSRPWECDVTDAVTAGDNTIEVIVIGTLKNTLGPHHAGGAVGSAWPGAFRQAPKSGPPAGSAYHTLGYGLFEPFVLEQVAQQTAAR